MRHPVLYLFILVALGLLVAASLGGGPWGAGSTLQHWTGELFRGICHQNPLRSYSVNGVQMAVNTRCFGVFSGLLAGWLMIPVMIRIKPGKSVIVGILLFAVLLQIIDFSGNLFELWSNTNHSRFLAGTLPGIAAVLFISELFIQPDPKLHEQ